MMRKTFMIVAAMMLFVVTMWARPALKGTAQSLPTISKERLPMQLY